jgi:hypothetical protein
MLDLIIRLKDEASQGLSSIGASMGAMINPASAALVAVGAIGAGLGASINVAKDYEATLNKFASVTGDSLTQAGMSVETFNDLFLEMGAKTAFSAQQAADAAVELAKGGLDPATIAGQGLEATLSLAAAGQLELAEAANITAKQLGVWSSTGVDATTVANQMAQAANASTVDVDELALGMANVGGVAKVAGLSFKETTQAMALLAPGFSSAADAGTSFKAFLNNLQPTSKAAVRAMSELGLMSFNTQGAIEELARHGIDAASMSAEQMRGALFKVAEQTGLTEKQTQTYIGSFEKGVFYDAAGQFVGMEKAAQLLHDATKDLTTEQRALAFETIFGSDAQRAAALIAEQGAEGYNKMGTAMDNAGTAQEQAAKMNQGLAFALDSLGGSLETIGIQIGMKAIPIITEFINNAVIPAINGIGEFINALLNGGPQVEGFGASFGTIFNAIKSVVDAVMPAIAAVVGEAVQLISEFWQENGTEIMAFVQEMWTTIQTIITLAMQVIQAIIVPAFTAIATFIQQHGTEIKQIFTTVFNAISTIVRTVTTVITSILRAFLALLKGDTQGALNAVRGLWEGLASAISNIANGIAGTVSAKFNEIKNNIVGSIQNAYNEVVGFVERFKAFGTNIINSIVSGITGAAGALLGALRGAILNAINAAINIFPVFLRDAIRRILNPGGASTNSTSSAGKGGAPLPTDDGTKTISSAGASVVINVDARGANMSEAAIRAIVEKALNEYARRAESRVRMA